MAEGRTSTFLNPSYKESGEGLPQPEEVKREKREKDKSIAAEDKRKFLNKAKPVENRQDDGEVSGNQIKDIKEEDNKKDEYNSGDEVVNKDKTTNGEYQQPQPQEDKEKDYEKDKETERSKNVDNEFPTQGAQKVTGEENSKENAEDEPTLEVKGEKSKNCEEEMDNDKNADIKEEENKTTNGEYQQPQPQEDEEKDHEKDKESEKRNNVDGEFPTPEAQKVTGEENSKENAEYEQTLEVKGEKSKNCEEEMDNDKNADDNTFVNMATQTDEHVHEDSLEDDNLEDELDDQTSVTEGLCGNGLSSSLSSYIERGEPNDMARNIVRDSQESRSLPSNLAYGRPASFARQFLYQFVDRLSPMMARALSLSPQPLSPSQDLEEELLFDLELGDGQNGQKDKKEKE